MTRSTTGSRPEPRPRLRSATSRDSILVAVSGPDGAGKTTLVGRLVPLLRAKGYVVTRTYCYGCVLCRRFPRRRARSAPPPDGFAARALTTLGAALDAVHARVDAADLALRLAVARLLSAMRGRDGGPTVIVSDRGPLDGLVKFDPPASSRTAALFKRLDRAYDLTLLLDARPGARADGAVRHRPGGRRSGDPRERFRRWAPSLTGVVPMGVGADPPPAAAETALRLVRECAAAARTGPAAEPAARRRVVVSIYDDATNEDYRGGGAVVVDKVARRLSEEFDVTVLTAGRHSGTSVRDGLRYRHLPVCWAGPRAGQLLFQAALPLMARRIPHDVWLESFTPPFTTSFLPLFTKAPVVGVNQCRGGESTWRKYHVPTFLVEYFGLRFYRDIVVLNGADAADTRRHSPHASIHLIENGVDPRDVDDSAFGNGGHIVCLGRIDVKMKGLELLLPAYEKAAPDLPLLIAGHGTPTEERRLKALLARTDRDVRWLGYTTEERKEQLLADSAFMVMPSRHETFGLVALESMSYGKPVLHFELPWLHWMSDKGNVGVPPFDVDGYAEQIRRLAADAGARRDLGRRAHQASQYYTWDRMTGRYLALVRQLLTPPAPGTQPVPEEVDASWPVTR
ncbi:glycosyltransferase [Streptomyces sp. TRM49041]|uniref:glycosyltransferase n=1 Tax=Streptomyces sp. TRM49041 TaxID=2603216 RepID=UPI0011EC4712|nr:glycosyltransferase [Streptomyces sp. TRM49041]